MHWRDNMKYRYPALIAVLIVLIALAVAGCTSTTTTSPAVSGQPAASGTPATSVTATPSSGTSSVTLFDMGKFSWYTYRMNAAGQNVDMKTATTTGSYGGVSAARHLTSTMTMGTGDQAMVTVTDTYFDPSTDKLLGGHTKATMGGSVLYDKDIAADDSTYAKSDYAGQSTTAIPVPSGVESVTVPKGTYTATKYTITNSDGTVNYWLAAGVPMPVKMEVTASGTTAAMELVDYG